MELELYVTAVLTQNGYKSQCPHLCISVKFTSYFTVKRSSLCLHDNISLYMYIGYIKLKSAVT